MQPLVSVAELANNPHWRLLDCRHDLATPSAGRAAYAQGHLPGAHFLHLDDDLSGPRTGRNGRHPLPDADSLCARLRACGIDDDSVVVAYDADVGMFAARAWWLLRWLGHVRVAVLDGGLAAWRAAGHALTSEVPDTRGGTFQRRPSLCATVDAEQLQVRHTSVYAPLIVDARAPDRFAGANETLDPIGGHIPGAINRFFRHNIGADGHFKDAASLRAEWSALLGARPVAQSVHQCGSGVTACHNLLALEVAGLSGAALYPGSWSEWCSDPARPVATGAT